MSQFLSPEERSALKQRHRKERDKRICDRIKAVILYDNGWTPSEIAEALLLSDECIRKHIQDYKKSTKLRPENGGSVSKLTPTESKELEKHLEEHTYLYVKEIVAYVEKTFKKKYTVSGMTHWLRSHSFSYKKPAIIPGKADPEAQKKWISDYEKLKNSLKPDEAICFMDGVHPTHNVKRVAGWIKVGHRKEIRTNTGRQRINLSGAIDIHSKQVITHEDETLNAVSTIKFLKNIELSYPAASKIYTYSDNARYYRNKEVMKFLETSKIELRFLPPYSPNLNPIERLWKFVNENILYNKYYEKFKSFKEAVLGFLESLKSPDSQLLQILKTRITDNFQIIGAG